jgi:hypothetical protein
LKPLTDRIERLVPGNGHESGILVATFFRIAALHRRQYAAGIVGFLHRAIGLDAAATVGRVDTLCIEVRQYLAGDAVTHLYFHQARTCDTVVAIGRDCPDFLIHGLVLDAPTVPF